MEKSEYYHECMTVVVPVYNRHLLVKRCLDGIYAQSYRPIQVIVVDNASTDSTVESVKEWAASHQDECFTLNLLQENKRGASYARQKGLMHADTEKIMFFDSDDLMRPDAVSTIMKEWRKDPSIEAVAWPLVVHRKSGSRRSHSISGNLLERHMIHAIFCTLGYAVKTDVIKACGGWKGEYSCWDDLETGIRLLLRSPKVKALRVPLAEVFPQEESISGISLSAKAGKWEEALDGIDVSISESGRKDKERLHNLVSYRRAILAADYFKEGRAELAKPLYERAQKEVSKEKRPLIRFAYHWTKRGFRGAFSIVGPFL